ncbi:hypothetical protein JRO89_XS13G0069300 [Xanthoceras sorbifolium]|uniref:CCD97-like C-terminal domain-containing protein n=1 Tax=Xanthoceras sorbifolium TaxID=99658 RepID=A0ABQ8H711_9ROSI|nr:hypothetical protein JRO89_XS13G0069300 [Xanthoceras sorbifolium]
MERKVKEETMESITERLSSLDNLYFPRALQSNASTPSQRKSILLDLLSRDAVVFLESKEQDESNFEELRSRSVTVKNRRLAYLNKLIGDGHYFSEDAMREREPYLHHEYVGKFQDLSERSMARPGERWSETLIRRAEEAILVAKIREEQQRLGVDEREWVVASGPVRSTEMFPVDSQMLLDHSVANNGAQSTTAEHYQGAAPSAEETEDSMEQFTHIMQQKFLSGEDHQHFDYSKIDNDETLDDHWLREVSQDAEEKYFAED